MVRKKRNTPVHIPGLPKPWSAYMHLIKKRIFYHNSKTGQSLWELPADIREKCSNASGELGDKFDGSFPSHVDNDDDIEAMDCTDWDDAIGNSPAENVPDTCHVAFASTLTSATAQDECEDMDIDFSDDLRQLRGIHYDQDAVSLDSSYEDIFSVAGTSRFCVVFDTCALIDDPELINDCMERLVHIVIPYRVFYELDNMKKISSTSPSGVQLRSRAIRLVHKLRDLRSSPLVHWESSSESFAPVDGFVTSTTDDINDDFILKCAYQIKRLLEVRGDGWQMIFLTNDQVLSLKAHANKIPCYSGKEAKTILKELEGSTFLMTGQTREGPSASKKRPSGNVKSADKIRVSTSGSCSTRPNRKDLISEALARPLPTICKKKTKEIPSMTADIAEMNSLKEFSEMWNRLISTLKKRLKKCSIKERKDIVRLRQAVSCFCKEPTEKNLAVLVQMTSWLYFYYLPPSSNKEQKMNYKELLKSGLFKQISTCSRRSQRLMEAFRYFRDDFVIIEKESLIQ